MDCLIVSVWAVATSAGWREAVLKAVNLAEHTDTTGWVAGGLARCLWGRGAVPAEWIATLVIRHDIAAWVERAWPPLTFWSTRSALIGFPGLQRSGGAANPPPRPFVTTTLGSSFPSRSTSAPSQ